MVAPQKTCPPKPVNVNLFGRRGFRDIVKALDMTSFWIPEWALNPTTRRRPREVHLKMEAEMG